MNKLLQTLITISISIMLVIATGCEGSTTNTSVTAPTPTVTPTVTPTPAAVAENDMPMTLPLLDAFFFSDESFATDLKTILQLTDDQVSKLRAVAREETASLRETPEDDQGNYQGSTNAAAELAKQRVIVIMGDAKTRQLTEFVLRRWQDGRGEIAMTPSPLPSLSPVIPPTATVTLIPTASPTLTPGTPRVAATASPFIPSDTRVVINSPAYRMDIFKDGQLIKSYKVGIGYPEFPVPTGERRATSIIFNPTWTPPDEPWVESSNKVKVGEKVEAGSTLNPLGLIKIPIGLPSLIHGGKAPSQLGKFASHGCVGMTNRQIQTFAQTLAGLGGTEISGDEITRREKSRTKTESVKMNRPVPVELRYETIVVEDGKLHIYRDVYERGTNTEESVREILSIYGVTNDQLTEEERAQVTSALQQMSRGPGGTPVEETSSAEKEQKKKRNIDRGRLTRIVKGQKEAVIEIAALAGKGYPAPVEIDAGSDKRRNAKVAK